MSVRRPAVALAAFLLLAPPGPAQSPLPAGVTKGATVEGITEYRLANGLQVLLFPDDSKPLVTVNLTVFVGSRHEGYGETGMAHLLEHMLFKGSPKFPDVPKALRDHGASFNGTTWVDRTNYFETMPATEENLTFGIELEADRMVNSFVRREDLVSEFSVVRNEFERGENSPENVLSQRMMATAYEWHNYGKSTIGNRTDIERVPIDSLRAFYKKYYRPDNAMLVVAGKFDANKALALIAGNFGPIKNPEDPLPKTYTEEPPQDGERLVTLRRVGTVGAVGVVYHVPSGPHPDFAAVQVLDGVLTDEPAGRLYKALVESKLATRVTGSSYAWHDPGVFEVLAQTTPETTEKCREVMLATLEGLTEKPVTADEVERIKRQYATMTERLTANSQQFAVRLSEWAAAGDWRLFFVHRDRIEKVTPDQVNRVAQTYLVRSNRTVGVYVPTKAAERASVPETPDVAGLVKDYKGRAAVAAGEAFDPTPENIEKRTTRGTVGEGVKTAFLPKKTRGETVSVTLNLRFGNEDALKGKTTAASYLGPMLMRGTKTKSRQQIQDELDKLNARLSVTSTAGSLTATISTKRPNLPAVLALLGEVLRQPAFPESEFDILKRESLEELDKGRTDPQALAMTALRRTLSPYPADNVRYVATLEEQIERTKSATVAQVKELYDTMLGSQAGELAAVGDFDPAATAEAFNGFLKGWKAAVPFARIEQTAQETKGGTTEIVTPDKANAVYLAGQRLALSDADPAYPALTVGNYLLGQAPLASRLSNRVRGKEGLSYGVGSMVQASSKDRFGAFMVFAITNPTNMPKVDVAIADEIKKFLADGVSASELEEAKRAYLQKLQVQRGNDGSLASELTDALYAGRTYSYYADLEQKIAALQPGDVKKAFDAAIDPKKLAIVEAGDFKKK